MNDDKPARFECGDVVVRNDEGQIVFSGPRFLRCTMTECGSLVTHAIIQQHGGCVCGGRRVRQAVKVTPDEETQLMRGRVPLLAWERELLG